MIKKALCALIIGLTTPLIAEDLREASADLTKKATALGYNRILYLMQAGNISTALNVYQEHFDKEGEHDLELVQNIGLILLDQGFKSDDEESQLLTLFGAGISMNERAIYILEDGMRSRNPQLQYVSMNELARLQNDSADESLKKAMASNYLPIRLECLYHLAEKKVPSAAHYAEALMSKVDAQLLPMFPQYFAMIGDDHATRILRKLLNHPKENVRVEAVLCVTKHGRDDLLPTIRTLATHHLMVQQEACAVCLGVLKDDISVPKLESMKQSGCATVRLAALHALFRLGKHELREQIEEAAKADDCFAITLLGEISGSEELLVELIKSQNVQVRVNATIALLKRQDPRCLYPLAEILVRDSRDLAFTKVHSPSKAMFFYKAVPSARQNFKDDLIPYEVSLAIRENTLELSSVLPEKEFICLANMLFENQQHDLIPTLVRILESLHTPEAIELLKKHQQKAGAPLIRNYCNLALYRLKEEGPYADNLKAWVAAQHGEDFIFRPLIPWEMRDASGPYQLTPQEKSRLLIESCQALTQSQDDFGVNVLLHVIQKGNSKNKYALAGLLIRAAQ